MANATGPWRDGGWHQGAERCPSPNFGPRPPQAQIDLLVVHSISLPPGQYGTQEVQRFFCNQLDHDAHPYYAQLRGMQVSAHFFITRTGALIQFVSVFDRAWHAGRSQYRGRENCNDDSVGVELEGLEGQTFEPAQYAALAALGQDLQALLPLAHVAGHEHVAPGRKGDPGAGFDWALLARLWPLPPQYFPQVVRAQLAARSV